jgi:hypothetical protein
MNVQTLEVAMRRLITVGIFATMIAATAMAQNSNHGQPSHPGNPGQTHSQAHGAFASNAVTHGQFAQLVLDIGLGYREATPDPLTALEKLQGWGVVPTTWQVDEPLTHSELSDILGRIAIDYLPPRPDKPVSGGYLISLLWRNIGKLRDYMASRLGHNISANHVLDAGVDRAVSPSDFD